MKYKTWDEYILDPVWHRFSYREAWEESRRYPIQEIKRIVENCNCLETVEALENLIKELGS